MPHDTDWRRYGKVKMTSSDIESIRMVKALSAIGRKSRSGLYADRLKTNILGKGRKNRTSDAWDAILIAILSTQQKSTGRSNKVKQLLEERNLSWRIAKTKPGSISDCVNGFNLNRRKREYLSLARSWLLQNHREVGKYRRALDSIPVASFGARYPLEVEAAKFIQSGVKGIGPKQSRNFWQYLGYSAWAVLLDSRILAILEAPPFSLNTQLGYFELEARVIELCTKANTYPCLLDASLFDLEGLMRAQVGMPQ